MTYFLLTPLFLNKIECSIEGHGYPKAGEPAERYTLVPVTREELFTPCRRTFPKTLSAGSIPSRDHDARRL